MKRLSHQTPSVGWNKKEYSTESEKKRNERLKEISDLNPSDYADNVLKGIKRRQNLGILGRDATFDDY